MDDTATLDVRGKLQDDAESLRLMDYPDSTEEIPTLDISSYLAGSAAGRKRAASELDAISRTIGFFYLVCRL